MAGAPQTKALREDAFRFARAAHRDQRRDSDSLPFVHHPVDVADLLESHGFGQKVVAAALLHDVVENTDVEAQAIQRRFGDEVAALVGAMTEDERIERYETRKSEHRERAMAAGRDAAALFVADKVAKARELRAALAERGAEVHARPGTPLGAKLWHYEQTLAMVEGSPPHPQLVAELRDELVRLRSEASRVAARRRAA